MFQPKIFKKKEQPFHLQVSATKVIKVVSVHRASKEVPNLQEQRQKFSFLGYYEWSLTSVSPCYFCKLGTEILWSTELSAEKRSQASLILPFTQKKTELPARFICCCCCLFSIYTIIILYGFYIYIKIHKPKDFATNMKWVWKAEASQIIHK